MSLTLPASPFLRKVCALLHIDSLCLGAEVSRSGWVGSPRITQPSKSGEQMKKEVYLHFLPRQLLGLTRSSFYSQFE